MRVAVSGSFNRHLRQIYEAVQEFAALKVDVLSPADPRVVDSLGDFLFVASDRLRSIRLVQDRHLACISRSDFLWLVAPDCYAGQSAAMEIGVARTCGVPVLCQNVLADTTLRHYVAHADGIREAVASHRATRPTSGSHIPGVLIDPEESINRLHSSLEALQTALTTKSPSAPPDRSPENHLFRARAAVTRALGAAGTRL